MLTNRVEAEQAWDILLEELSLGDQGGFESGNLEEWLTRHRNEFIDILSIAQEENGLPRSSTTLLRKLWSVFSDEYKWQHGEAEKETKIITRKLEDLYEDVEQDVIDLQKILNLQYTWGGAGVIVQLPSDNDTHFDNDRDLILVTPLASIIAWFMQRSRNIMGNQLGWWNKEEFYETIVQDATRFIGEEGDEAGSAKPLLLYLIQSQLNNLGKQGR